MMTPDEKKLVDRVQAWNPLWKERSSGKNTSYVNPFSADYDRERAFELQMKGHILRREFDPSYAYYQRATLPPFFASWQAKVFPPKQSLGAAA